MQIATEYQNTFITNYIFCQAFFWNQNEDPTCGPITEDTVLIDTLAEEAIAADAAALIDMVADKLLAGDISDTLRDEIDRMLGLIPVDQVNLRVAEVIYFIVTSPEFAYQG